MKKLLLLLFAVAALSLSAYATDITVGASQQTALSFNPTNIGNDRNITVSVTNASPTVTSSAAFPSAIVGKAGFQVSIAGTQYVVASVASTSSLTLTTNFAGVTGSTTMVLYKYVLLRIYATASFQPQGAAYVVQASTPGSGNFFKEIAVSIINSGSGNVAWYPEFILPATTDASITNTAKYVFGLYRPDFSFLAFYACGNITQLALPTTTPTSFPNICAWNSPGGIVPPNSEVYTKNEINQMMPFCSSDTLLYHAVAGQQQACLALGSNLSITAGVLNASGGGGGGAPTDATYITQTSNVTLTNEQALASLSSGIMRVATTTGVVTSLTDSAGIASNISDETGTGGLVFANSPAIVTPTIASFTNATHSHENAAGGGQLNASNVFSAGTVPLARGGTNSSLADPGANRILGWDDTNNDVRFFIIGSGLSYDQATDTLSASGGGGMSIGGSVTSGTTGSVLFIGAGPVLAQDNSNFFWDDSNNRLGINTASPSFPLTVKANASSQIVELQSPDGTNTFRFTFTDAGVAGILATGNDTGFDIGAGATTSALRLTNLARFILSPGIQDATALKAFTLITPADTNITSGTESILVQIGGNASATAVTRNWVSSGQAQQRENYVVNPNYTTDDASQINNAITLEIAGAPTGNVVAAQARAFRVASGKSHFGGDVDIVGNLDVNGTGDISGTLLVGGDATFSGFISVATTGSFGSLITGDGGIDLITGTTAGVAVSVFPGAYLDAINAEIVDLFFGLDREVNFATGTTLTNQRAVRFTNPTYSADASKTITNAATVSILAAPIAGTNVTFTNLYALWVQDGKAQFTPNATFAGVNVGSAASNPSTPSNGDLYYNSGSNELRARIGGAWVALGAGGGGGNCTVAGSQGDYQINSGASNCAAGVITQGTNGRLIASPTLTSSGALSYFRIVTPVDTGQTADAEMPGIVLGGNASGSTVTRTGADGTTIASQREVRVVNPTYAFAGATTITRAATFAIDGAPVAGGSATITNPYALWIDAGNAGLASASGLGWNDDTFLFRDGTRLVGLRGPTTHNGTTAMRVYGKFTSSTQYERASVEVDGSGLYWKHEHQNEGNRTMFWQFNVTTAMTLSTNATLRVGDSGTATAQLEPASQSTTRAAFAAFSATNSTADLLQGTLTADDTSTIANYDTWNCRSNGTAATGFGCSQTVNGESSTTNDQNLARLSFSWNDATHASRTGRYAVSLVQNAGSFIEFFAIIPTNTTNGGVDYYFGPVSGVTAAGVPFALHPASASGTNIGGSTLTLVEGRSTGTGASSPVKVRFAAMSTSSGTTLNGEDAGAYAYTNTMFTVSSTATVANTTTETTLLGTMPIGDNVIGAGVARVGRSVTWEVFGHVAVTATPNLTIRFKIGSTTVSTQTFTALNTTTTSRLRCTFTTTSRTFSATGTAFTQGDCRVINEASGATFNATGVNTATATIDWTANQTVDLTGQWSAASSSNTVSVTNVIPRWDN